MKNFIGRKQELEDLKHLYDRRGPGLVVIKGRRRIGKSRLIAEFASQYPKNRFWSFAGIAPEEGATAQSQRDHFAEQLSVMLNMPPKTFANWSRAFEYLSSQIKDGDIILFDEISWMAIDGSLFIPKLKAWWDKQTKHVVLALCGSVSTWIEENILKSTAFFGRINLTMTLEPLSIGESAELLRKRGIQCSHYETYMILSIMGGVPWYLEQLNPAMTVDENMRRLAFSKNGLLVVEFDRIFHDLFNGKGSAYKRILEALRDGTKTLAEIREAINFAHSGTLSQLMEHLVTAGFVQKQPLWSLKTKKRLKQSLYRIDDPYLRFYFKMIESNLAKISANRFKDISLSAMPGFEIHMGLQLECLLLQNRELLLNVMGIRGADIVADGPYRQFATKTQKGCQIDYLVQTVTNNLFVSEFKFHRRELKVEVMDDMKKKINALKVPRGFAAVPVLFHLDSVTSYTVGSSLYFYRIIDISDFLEQGKNT